jgi:hypothetical protein
MRGAEEKRREEEASWTEVEFLNSSTKSESI